MLAYETSGTGPTALLLHAGVADRRMWGPLAERLGGAVRLVMPDLRGFGDSPVGDEPYDHVEDVLAVLDDTGTTGPVAVCGNSFGGLVALALAARAPERVARLVLVAPPLSDWDWQQAMRDYGEQEDALLEAGDLDGAVELNVRQWAADLPSEQQDLVRVMQRRAFELAIAGTGEDRDEAPLELASVRVPTHILVGERDQPDFVAIAEHLAATLPSATLRRVPDAGHLLPVTRAEEVAAAIRAAVVG